MNRRILIAALIGLGCILPEELLLYAQVPGIAGGVAVDKDEEKPELGGQNLFVTDRRMSRQLSKARELLQGNDQDRTQGMRLLQNILDNAEDVFFMPDEQDKTRYHGLKAEVRGIIAGFDAEGRRSYELEYGTIAQRMLDEATESRDVGRLEEVSRQFFHTRAGCEATYMLGSYHLDNSRPLAAVLNFERLRNFREAARRWEPMLSLKTAVCWGRLGMPQRSVEALVELKATSSRNYITLGGKRIEFFDRDQAALDWLVMVLGRQQAFESFGEESWAMFRGNAARNAFGSKGCPILDSQWQFPTVRMTESEDPRQLEIVEARLKRTEENYREAGFLTLPAVHPLVIDGTVIVRSLGNIKAVDPQSGELLWETVIKDASLEKLLEQGIPTTTSTQNRQPSLETFLTQRAWRDMTAGTLSSDGKYVFAVEELGFLGSYQYISRGTQHPMAPKDYNKLMAFELAGEGRAAWAIGGQNGEGNADFAGTFFLGPPLPLRGQLYCLVEARGEIRLLVLEPKPDARPATAELGWSQSLIVPQSSLLQSPVRRLAGISPSYADGVMVCPTAAGAVVAIDLGRRELLWGYRYPTNSPVTPQNARMILFARMAGQLPLTGNDDGNRWIDAVPTLAEGRVLLTPRDSDELHCLNLADGTLQWKEPRGQGLYVAAVYDGKVVVVGRGEVSALRLSDGEPVWERPTSIPAPSGRGVASDGFYHLPLSTGEVVTLDLNSGRILARSALRAGRVPGNLAIARGMMVSQSIDSVFGFTSFETLNDRIAAAFKKNPDDAEALALRGEMRLHRGEEAAGLADLRRCIEIRPIPRARALLAEYLLDRLRRDFAKNRATIDEIEKLLDDPSRRARFVRLYADGLQQVGEHRAAFAEYIKLAGPDTGRPQLERINTGLAVRGDRWVRTRLAELYRNTPAEGRTAMNSEIRAQLAAARKHDGPEPLEKFLNCFTGFPIAEEARRELAGRLDAKNEALRLAFQLEHLRRSQDPAVAGFATARLIPLLLDSNRPDLATDLVDELSGPWKDVACLEKKKGAQLAEEWKKNELVAEAYRGTRPFGEDADASSTKRTHAIQRYYPIPFEGPQGDAFESWTLVIDQSRQNLIARDGDGARRWSLSLKESGAGIQYIASSRYRSAYYARTCGHLMVVVLGNQFLVVDALGTAGTPAILWKHHLYKALPAGQSRIQLPFLPAFGGRAFTPLDPFGQPMGKVGPISDDMICYQVGTRLYAADPLSGETLWERGNMDRGSDIFGDDGHVLVVAPGARQATVLRAGDGEFVGTRPMPSGNMVLLTSGRHLLMQDDENGKVLLAFTDVLAGKTIWRKEFSTDAKVELVKGDEIAVFEPSGHFTVLRLASGQPHIDCRLEPDANVNLITVLRSRDGYMLLTYHPETDPKIGRVIADQTHARVNGYAYGFDRQTGRRLWTTRVAHQAFDPNQPDNLPILVFSARRFKQQQKPRVPNQPQLGNRVVTINEYVVTILDKRNGRVIFEDTQTGNAGLATFELTADRQKQTIQVNFLQSAVTLTFGDDQPAVVGERT